MFLSLLPSIGRFEHPRSAFLPQSLLSLAIVFAFKREMVHRRRR